VMWWLLVCGPRGREPHQAHSAVSILLTVEDVLAAVSSAVRTTDHIPIRALTPLRLVACC